MATVYHRDQAGAPALAYTTTPAAIANFASLKVILKACLVDGYGSKPAAGWELISEDSRYLVLRNGTHSGYVCLSFTASYGIAIYLAETYTGVVSNVMTGDGLKTGVAANNATPHRLNLTFLAYSSAQSSWYLVADNSTFMFVSGGYNTLLEALNDGLGYPWKSLYVGEDTAGHFIAVGGVNTASDGLDNRNYFASYGFTALKNPDTGLLVGPGSISPALPALDAALSQHTWRTTSVLALDYVPLSPAGWGLNGSIVAGQLKGVVQCGPLICVTPSKAAQSIGFSGALTVRNLNTPINLGDGYSYFMGVAFSSSATFMVTDNPVFW